MKNKLICASMLALSISLSGCGFKSISHGREISEKEASNIEIGKTSREDVIIMFGEPSKITDDGKVFFYGWTRGSKVEVLGMGGGSSEGKSLVVIFNNDGIVKNYRITIGMATGQQID
ncbi:hypothetical protein H1Q59_02480 [Holosporaceae bacterium 'Namur']|nr:hypothetical protein [Holosporaceae bacterium 'Namur']